MQEEQLIEVKYLLSYHLQFFAEGGDKTEEPTSKKLGDAREEGQVAQSKELITGVGLLSLFLSLKILAGTIGTQLIESYQTYYSAIHKYTIEEFTNERVKELFYEIILDIIIIILPILLITVALTIVVILFQVKWKVSSKPLQPKLSKINPIQGFSKIFSKEKIVELLLDVVKVGVVSIVAYNTLESEWQKLYMLYDIELVPAVLLVSGIVIDLGMTISLIFLVIGLADFIYQKIIFRKKMRMSKQEVKDEYKNSEGDPQLKGRIKSKMREASQRRMMQALPQADVVITNPTHFACAIKYDKDSTTAPVLLAKGADYIAQKIKETAKEHKIEIVENKPLARMLYYNVEIGNEIPAELYQMTAEVLAYVYNLKNQ